MGKFSAPVRAPVPPIKVRTVTETADTTTHEGGAGYSRDPKSELFLLAVTNMVSEDTFYETGKDRDARFESLAEQVIKTDPDWVRAFVPALRDTLNMRSASIVLAALYARAKGPQARQVVSSALVRADEPAEMLSFWTKRFGRAIPKSVKRGVADAVTRLYSERNALKWDSDRSTMRMGDVIELVHPEPKAPWQGALFRYLIDDRHGRAFPGQRPGVESIGELGLHTIALRKRLEAVPVAERRARLEDVDFFQDLEDSAATWEWLGGWLQGPMDKVAWKKIIPQMGYMAILRNLRNFEQAGVSETVKQTIALKLTEPSEVAKSRQLPIRFYSAYKALETRGWDATLERALDLTLQNIPVLPGRTLVMIDVSGSMHGAMSGKSKLDRAEVAGLFGAALALRNEGDLYAYGNIPVKVAVRQGESVLKGITAIQQASSHAGGGTQTWPSTNSAYQRGNYDRIVIVTDEQAWPGGYDTVIPAHVPVYTFNVAGYAKGHAPSFGEAKRYTFGGLTDAGFAAIALLETGVEGIAAVA